MRNETLPQKSDIFHSAAFIALHGFLLALVLILGFLEQQWLLVPAFPGIKMGLSNIVLLFALCTLSCKSAWLLMLLKVFLSGLLFTGFASSVYALAGGIMSLMIMMIALYQWKLSIINVSICGAVFHIAGQLLISKWMLGTWAAFVQLPWLLLASLITGFFTGYIAGLLCTRLSNRIPHAKERMTRLGMT